LLIWHSNYSAMLSKIHSYRLPYAFKKRKHVFVNICWFLFQGQRRPLKGHTEGLLITRHPRHQRVERHQGRVLHPRYQSEEMILVEDRWKWQAMFCLTTHRFDLHHNPNLHQLFQPAKGVRTSLLWRSFIILTS